MVCFSLSLLIFNILFSSERLRTFSCHIHFSLIFFISTMSCWSFFILHNSFDPSWTNNISWRDSQPASWWFSRQGFTILIRPKFNYWLQLSQFAHWLKVLQTCQLTLILKLLLLMLILMRVTFTTFLLHISCCFGWKRFNTRYKPAPLSFSNNFWCGVLRIVFSFSGLIILDQTHSGTSTK